MNAQDVTTTAGALTTTAGAMLIAFGLKALGAIAVWVVGRWLIGFVVRMLGRALTRQHVDPTLMRYMGNILTVALNVVLVVAILGYFGVETTSFAALVAGVGVAVGAAWGGLLANLAAGAFLVVLRPFKVRDYVKAGGVEGTIDEVGLFATTITSPDNVVTLVGNNSIFSDTIQNFSSNPHRRVDLKAQLAHGVDVHDAIRRLKTAIGKIPNITGTPAPEVEVLEFTAMGPVLAVRPSTNTAHYWQVYFDTNRAIIDTFGSAGYPVPETHYRFHQTA
jgi:small conductance mechanosensitive channel